MGTEKGEPVRQEIIYIGFALPAGLMFKDGVDKPPYESVSHFQPVGGVKEGRGKGKIKGLGGRKGPGC